MSLYSLINPDNLGRVAPRKNHTENVLKRLCKYESAEERKGLNDEEVWTLLIVYGFVANGEAALLDLARVLTGKGFQRDLQAWLEMQPIPPRRGNSGKSERSSQIDLLVGNIARRDATLGGVKYHGSSSGYDDTVCFVEAKWLSDIATRTTHDWGRNQLARVIETALTFQGNRQWPSRVHVTLLTPALFKTPRETSASRLYAYKWREYVCGDGSINKTAIRNDIDRSLIPIRKETNGWSYPDLEERLGRLSMSWVTYEEVLSAIPASEFRTALNDFTANETDLLQKSEVG